MDEKFLTAHVDSVECDALPVSPHLKAQLMGIRLISELIRVPSVL
jgi:hypothetical protein